MISDYKSNNTRNGSFLSKKTKNGLLCLFYRSPQCLLPLHWSLSVSFVRLFCSCFYVYLTTSPCSISAPSLFCPSSFWNLVNIKIVLLNNLLKKKFGYANNYAFIRCIFLCNNLFISVWWYLQNAILYSRSTKARVLIDVLYLILF